MSMKKKLRRAFRAVTPDVLNKVTRREPLRSQPEPSEAAVTPVEKKPKLPYWLRETAATAAAFALLVGVVGGGLRLARDHQSSGSTVPTVTPALTVPRGPNSETIPLCDDSVLDCVYTACELVGVEATHPVQVEVADGSCRVTIENEYTYLFTFGTLESVSYTLNSIEIVVTNNYKTGYIAEGVAAEMALLHARANYGAISYRLSDVELALPGINEDGTAAYHVKVECGLSGIRYYVDYIIHAVTGEILQHVPDHSVGQTPMTSREARDIALTYLSLELKDLQYLLILPNSDGSYTVSVRTPDVFSLTVGPNGTVMELTKNIPQETDPLAQAHHIGWQTAIEIALDIEGGFDLDSLCYLNCMIFTDSYGTEYYWIEFGDDLAYRESGDPSGYVQLITATGGELYFESTSINGGYSRAIITEDQAKQLALNAHSLAETQVGAPDVRFDCELVYESGSIRTGRSQMHYAVQITVGNSCYSCNVNAFTGGVSNITVEATAPDGRISEEYATDIALKAMGFTRADAYIFGTSVDESGSFYQVHFFAAGCEYTVDVGLYDSGYIRHTVAELSDEMEHLQVLLGTAGTLYSTSLCCLYESPAELNLSILFSNGFDDGVPLTEEETAALKDVLDLEQDIIRLPASKMDDALKDRFGISLYELQDSCFNGLTYLEATDCYYMVRIGTLSVKPSCIAMTLNADGTLSLYYYNPRDLLLSSVPPRYYIITLWPLGGGQYQIISNTAHSFVE